MKKYWLRLLAFGVSSLLTTQVYALQLCPKDAPILSDPRLIFKVDGPRDAVNTTFENAQFKFPNIPSIVYVGGRRCNNYFETTYMNGQLNIGSLRTNGDYIDTGEGFGVKIEFTDPNNGNNWTKLVQNGSTKAFQTFPFSGKKDKEHNGINYAWMSDLGLSLRITGLVKYGGALMQPGQKKTIILQGAFFEVKALEVDWLGRVTNVLSRSVPIQIEIRIEVGALKTCKLNNSQIRIDLKEVSKSDLERQQIISGQTNRNDDVSLTCESGIKVYAVLTDLKEPIEKDYLNTYVQTAQGEQDSGVAFKIKKAGESQYLKLGPATSDAVMLEPSKNYQFKFGPNAITTNRQLVSQRFFVDYAKKPGAKIIPGNIKGMAQITFSYQ